MACELLSRWIFDRISRNSPRRRRPVAFDAGDFSESLEARAPLASLSGGAAIVSDLEHADSSATERHHRAEAIEQRTARKGPALYPDMTGHWRIVTEFSDHNLNGSLDLVQRGRKVKGTLTNDGQEPGKFKGKFEKPDAGKVDLVGVIVGVALNRALDSKELAAFSFLVEYVTIITIFSGKWTLLGDDTEVHGSKLNGDD